jgi:predicted heme/steroid binding protein
MVYNKRKGCLSCNGREDAMKEFTPEELQEYDGRNGLVYVAYDGAVYDVTKSPRWRTGVHQRMHEAGMDQTGEFKRAPHGPNLLKKFPVVGKLKTE